MSKTVKKALKLLSIFTEEKPYWNLEEISECTKIPKTTVHRLLQTFIEEGLIQKNSYYQDGYFIETNTYQLGSRFLTFSQIVSRQYEVRNIALPYMRFLQERLQESVQLVIIENDEAVYIEKVESNKPVRLYTKIGRRAPLYAGACPRILLSFLPNQEIKRILTKTNKKILAANTPKTDEEIWELIHATRELGFTYSDSELQNGTAAFGTPIFNRYGEITASLSVASFSSVLKKEDYKSFVYPMWEVCGKISKDLGFHNYKYK